MKLNNKGFTLIELLVTVVIIGLALGITIYGIINVIKKFENKKNNLSESSIKEAARIYSSEYNSNSWKDDGDNESFCVTVGELINKGLLTKNKTLVDGITKETFIIVKRNKITFIIDEIEITNDNSTCT